ncbi:GNAT family N-acetyltransferase [Edaphobacter sp. HDX4]|uniref:GNAT family N-acetyltransferase n=1 Tax=Edaphobacter sp. HDX4 TaxID=2794064 RepID=UPI002FE56AA0
MPIVIQEASSRHDIAFVRQLMRDYGNYLADSPSGAASICLSNYEQELHQLPSGYAVLLLASVDDTPAGCVALREIPAKERACEMKRLWVDSGFRGLSLGRRLIEAAIQWATDRGFHSMYLDTVPAAMPEAVKLYSSFGFVPVERYNENPVPGLAYFAKRLH